MARFGLFDGVDGEKADGVDDARGSRSHGSILSRW
jgi:hypothetical protein